MEVDISKQLILILIESDIRQKRLLYDYKDADNFNYSCKVNLMDTAFHWFGLHKNEYYLMVEQVYMNHLWNTFETTTSQIFRENIHEIACQLYDLIKTYLK